MLQPIPPVAPLQSWTYVASYQTLGKVACALCRANVREDTLSPGRCTFKVDWGFFHQRFRGYWMFTASICTIWYSRNNRIGQWLLPCECRVQCFSSRTWSETHYLCTYLTTQPLEYKQQQRRSHDASSSERSFTVGEWVYAKNFGQGQRWLPSVITEVTGPVSFMVKLQDGRCVRRHQDHLRIRKTDASGQRPPVIAVDKEPDCSTRWHVYHHSRIHTHWIWRCYTWASSGSRRTLRLKYSFIWDHSRWTYTVRRCSSTCSYPWAV
jgi:hypothetical protein